MSQPQGPGSPFVCLFDEQSDDGLPLPDEFINVYGRWTMPNAEDRPYVFVNFVTSRDGRISFNEPGKSSGGPISGYLRHDRWLMGLLRARADAVVIGASALKHATRHRWTPSAVFADEQPAWTALRLHEGRASIPLHVVVTRSGAIAAESVVISDPDVSALVVTTDDGVARARQTVQGAPNVEVISFGPQIDWPRLIQLLGDDYYVGAVLSEAGPQIYGAMLAAGVVDDEFLTLSPIVVGGSDEKPRPSLIEGAIFQPDAAPRSQLLSVRRVNDFLFLHSRYR